MVNGNFLVGDIGHPLIVAILLITAKFADFDSHHGLTGAANVGCRHGDDDHIGIHAIGVPALYIDFIVLAWRLVGPGVLVGLGLGNTPGFDHVTHGLEAHPRTEHGKLLLGGSCLKQADGIACRVGIGRERDGDEIGAHLVNGIIYRGGIGAQAYASKQNSERKKKLFHKG